MIIFAAVYLLNVHIRIIHNLALSTFHKAFAYFRHQLLLYLPRFLFEKYFVHGLLALTCDHVINVRVPLAVLLSGFYDYRNNNTNNNTDNNSNNGDNNGNANIYGANTTGMISSTAETISSSLASQEVSVSKL